VQNGSQNDLVAGEATPPMPGHGRGKPLPANGSALDTESRRLRLVKAARRPIVLCRRIRNGFEGFAG
jgi:hypothetical protein